jgi:hypothetical protein
VKAALLLTLFLSALLCTAGAQDRPLEAARGPEMKIGMTLVYVDFDSHSLNDSAQRLWQWDATLGLTPRFGVGIDMGYSRPDSLKGSPNHTLSYAIGPVWSSTINRNAQTYIHGFVGLTNVGGFGGFNGEGREDGALKLFWKLGAGVEIPVFGPVDMRIGVDYLNSQDSVPGGQIRGQTHLRQSIGLQYVLGGLRKRRHRVR